MSIAKKAFKSASWLGLFKLISQIFSWSITILVARILVPEDYGLMNMATVLTGYASMFSELGLGAAIIQKPGITTTDRELSSVFWFTLGIGILFALLCFVLAYPTAYIFNENRVIPITQTVSIIFLINGLVIVPFNLLKKDLSFKKIGFIEMTGVFISGGCMLLIAKMGGGVWTLIGGHIIRNFIRMVLIYFYAKWLPVLHFNLEEAKTYLKFGVTLAIAESLFYVYTKSDKYFAGRAWNPQILGYYSLALQLAIIPTEKIIVLINQVSFSAFALLQHDKKRFNDFYLNIVKVTAIIVLPVFVGGYLVGEDMIIILLGDKWRPMIFVFRYLCLAQILVAINAINNIAHNALGKPQLSLLFNTVCTLFIPISFYFSVQHGLNAIVIPWLIAYPAVYLIWILFTVNKIGINISTYGKKLMFPVLATLIMVLAIALSKQTILTGPFISNNVILKILIEIAIGTFAYLLFLYLFDREIFIKMKNLREE